MSFFSDLTIKLKLTTIILVTSIVAVILACTAFIIYEQAEFRRATVEKTKSHATMLGDNCKAALAFGDAQDATDMLHSLRAEQAYVFACLFTKDGEPMATYQRDGIDKAIEPPACSSDRWQFTDNNLVLFKQIVQDGEVIGTMYLRSDLRAMRAMLIRSIATAGVIIVISSLVAYLLSARLQGTISGPVLDLGRAARAISAGNDYPIQQIEHGKDEIGLLVDSFAEMLQQINDRETSLRESEEKFRTLFEFSTDAVIIFGKNSFTDCNASALKMFGYSSRKELLRKRPHELSPPIQPNSESSETLAQKWMVQAQREGHCNFEWTHRRLDGTDFPCEISLTVVDINDERVLQAVVRDITDRKHAEERLAIFHSFAQASVQGMGMADLDGHIVYANPALARMCDEKNPEDVIGKHVQTYYCKEASEILEEDILPQVFAKGQKTVELPLLSTSGTERHTSQNIFLIRDEHGQPFCIGNVISDITERKRVEEELREYRERLEELVQTRTAQLQEAMEQAESAKTRVEQINADLELSIEQASMMAMEATEASQTKSEFLANMSHEIRTPMNAIIGFTHVLGHAELSTEQQEYVRLIEEASKDLLQLINDILDFSKIEAGKLDTEIIEFSLADMLVGIDSLMRPLATREKLEFELLSDENLPSVIRTDPVRLRQCLVNLVSNAIKFTEKGFVHVNVSLDDRNDGSFIRFSIEDTGIGIQPEKQESVFESFSQGDGTTSRKYGGTGLGLSITRRLTKLLGGTLTVHSEPGLGSVFNLTIPVKTDAEHQQSFDEDSLVSSPTTEATVSRPNLSGTVLVAEDNPANQKLIELLLTRVGLTVHVASDGRQAVEHARARQFDLILMDIQMPEMNGYEATMALRQANIDTPIIALTAHAMTGDKDRCLKAGCDAYMSKPIDQNCLYGTLARYLPTVTDSTVQIKNEMGTTQLAEATAAIPPLKPSQAMAARCDHIAGDNHGNCSDEQQADTSPIISALADDPELFVVAEVFLDCLPTELQRISDAMAQTDWKLLEIAVHSLKGSASGAGYPMLSEQAAAIEPHLNTMEMDALTAAVDELTSLCHRVIAGTPTNTA